MIPIVPLGSASATATTSSAPLALPASGGELVEIANAGTVVVWANIGASDAVAVAGNLLIPAGQVRQFRLVPGNTHVALLSASSTALVGVTRGRER
jgi:hypothetical protein